MSGESCLGYFGALKIALSAVYRKAGKRRILGGSLLEHPDGYTTIPQDGLRIRFFDMDAGWAVILKRDALRKIHMWERKVTLYIENITGDEHGLQLCIRRNHVWKKAEIKICDSLTVWSFAL